MKSSKSSSAIDKVQRHLKNVFLTYFKLTPVKIYFSSTIQSFKVLNPLYTRKGWAPSSIRQIQLPHIRYHPLFEYNCKSFLARKRLWILEYCKK